MDSARVIWGEWKLQGEPEIGQHATVDGGNLTPPRIPKIL